MKLKYKLITACAIGTILALAGTVKAKEAETPPLETGEQNQGLSSKKGEAMKYHAAEKGEKKKKHAKKKGKGKKKHAHKKEKMKS